MWSKAHRLASQVSGSPAKWRPAHSGTHFHRAATPDLPAATVEVDGPTIEEQLAAAYTQGAADTQVLAEQALVEERKRLTETIREISGLRRAVLDAADDDLMQLAVGMARRILHREVQLDPDVLLAMAHVALGRLGDRAVVKVHLHPADVAVLSPADPSREALTLVPDLDIPRGGCRLTSEQGEIDLGIDAQMTELSRGLLGERADRHRANLH